MRLALLEQNQALLKANQEARNSPKREPVMKGMIPADTRTIEAPTQVTVDAFENMLRKSHRMDYGSTDWVDYLVFDLSRVKFLTLGGMLSVLALAGALAEGKLPGQNSHVKLYLKPPAGKPLDYLHRMQFFRISSLMSWFLEVQQLAEFDDRQKEIWERGKRRVFELRLRSLEKASWVPSFFLPIHFIPARFDQEANLARFENDCRRFLNSALETMQPILLHLLGFSPESVSGFWRANKEVYENVYRHSQSWGLTAVQAYKDKVHMCHVDIGLGITATLAPRYAAESEAAGVAWSDKSAIEKAFEQGGSRDSCSSGIGLTIVKKYVQERQGDLALRSGRARYLINRGHEQGFTDVAYFPGTQVYISIPRG